MRKLGRLGIGWLVVLLTVARAVLLATEISLLLLRRLWGGFKEIREVVLRRSKFLLFVLISNSLISSGIIASENQFALAVEQTNSETLNSPEPRLLLKPGQPITGSMQTEDVVATYDVALAREQVAAYPDSPEASFVLAVALTRTSMVEEALHEVRRARKLAENKGGPAYFDHMISEYEEMLKSYPNDNRVRYGLAWAYYMKAYVLMHYSKSVAKVNGGNRVTVSANISGLNVSGANVSGPNVSGPNVSGPNVSGPNVSGAKASEPSISGPSVSGTNVSANLVPNANWHNSWVEALSQGQSKNSSTENNPTNNATETIKASYVSKSDWRGVPPELVPQVKAYYECALRKLDELLVREPTDMWARSYRAFLYSEYSGDMQQAMDAWKSCLSLDPNNPAAYFFLGESYLQQGNLKECLHNISKAVALRSLPN